MDQFRSIDTSLLLVFGESPSGEGSAPGPDYIQGTLGFDLLREQRKAGKGWIFVQRGLFEKGFF